VLDAFAEPFIALFRRDGRRLTSIMYMDRTTTTIVMRAKAF
jgi:hypothetical protein